MSLDFYNKLTQSFGLLAIGILFGLIAFAATGEVKDLDLWLHMKTGEIITTTHQVPSVDVLSGTIAGKPWVNHQWLFQTVVHSMRVAFGIDGVLYLQVILVLFAFLLLLLWTYRSDRQLVILPLLFAVLQVYETRFTVRPDIFSVVYFILFIMILHSSISWRGSLIALFILQVLWTNMHGFFFWGPLLVLIFILAEMIKRYLPVPVLWREEARLSDEAYGRLGAAFIVVMAATLVNPQTWQGAAYPFEVLFKLSGDNRIFFKYISELQPTIDWGRFWDLGEQGAFKSLIIVSAISFLLNVRRLDLRLFFVWGVTLAFSAGAVRNMIYFAVVAYAITLLNLARMDLRLLIPLRFNGAPFEALTGWMAKIAVMVFLLNYGGDLAQSGYYDFNKYERKSSFLGVAQRHFPESAVQFLIDNRISGTIFNDFNTGAYIIGNAYPQVRVFIDGRTEVYGAKFFEDYRKIWDEGDEKAFAEALARYDFKTVFIGSAYGRPPQKVLKLMAKKKDWRLVYFDHDALIFLKDVPANAEIIRRHAIDLAAWEPSAPSDIYRIGSARVTPYREINRMSILADMGYPDKAIAEADRALGLDPLCLEAYRTKAFIYLEREDFVRSFENYRLALIRAPSDIKLRRGMALAYVGLGRYDEALEQAGRLDAAPDDPAGAYVRAKVFVKKKQYEKAYDILIQRLFYLERGVEEIMAIGDLCVEDGAFDWALKVYTLGVRKDPKDAAALGKLKEAQQKQHQQE